MLDILTNLINFVNGGSINQTKRSNYSGGAGRKAKSHQAGHKIPGKRQVFHTGPRYKKPAGPQQKAGCIGAKTARQSGGEKVLTVYHGTPQPSHVKAIRRDGWQVGAGNLHGDGVYFSTDLAEARGYAGSSGAVIECRVYLGKCAIWGDPLNKKFQDWCKHKNVVADSSAKTAFLLKRGYKTLRANSILVVLRPQFKNHTAWPEKVRAIKICSVHHPVTNARIAL